MYTHKIKKYCYVTYSTSYCMCVSCMLYLYFYGFQEVNMLSSQSVDPNKQKCSQAGDQKNFYIL